MRTSFLLVVAAALVPSSAWAQDTEWNRYTLEELVGVHLKADAAQGCVDMGVAPESLMARAQGALEEREIPLLTEEVMLATPGLPELRVHVDCSAESDGWAAYVVSLQVQQAAQMIRDAQITLSEAVTWYASGVGVTSAADIADAVSATLSAKVEEFATAFEEANTAEANPS